MQGAQDHRVEYTDGAISCNHRNHSDLQHSQAALQVERRAGNSDLDTNNSPPRKARASPLPEARNIIPIIHLYSGSALNHPVRPGGAIWTVGVGIGS